jgi:transcriptional regulator with XRE-family HTH domain
MSSTILRAQDGVTFGHMLRAERKALGKSQDEVAAAVGVRRQTIADLEHGKNVGSHIVFAALGALGKMVSITDARRPDLETMRAMMKEFDDD